MSHNIIIAIECILVDKYSQLKDNFKIINKNTPLPEFPEK